MLRKQTMWLLTMLTLVIVLSVYYVTNPDMGTTNLVEEQQGKESKETSGTGKMTVKEGTSAELTQLRLKINEQRDALKEELMAMAAAKDITADKKNELIEKSEQLIELGEKEATIEGVIKTQGYNDVLVKAEENEVQVYVVTQQDSKKKANEIIKVVRKELGQKEVAVQFQVPKK
ncbi:MAG: SpoIIIAH-like family protein [Bacillaceae bacterium]